MACSRIARTTVGLAGLVLVFAGVAFRRSIAQSFSTPLVVSPGALTDGTTLLPNGWRIAPAGRHLGVSTLPLNSPGIIWTYAGDGVAGHSGDGGPATAASITMDRLSSC